MYGNKTGYVYEDFSKNKKMLGFSNYSLKSKHDDDSNKFMVSKMKDETGGVAIKEFFWKKPNLYSILVDDTSDHIKAKDTNKNAVATIRHGEYKDVLLNKKCLRESTNRIQSKNHRIGTYEINKVPLSCFDDKMYILNIGYGRLGFGF